MDIKKEIDVAKLDNLSYIYLKINKIEDVDFAYEIFKYLYISKGFDYDIITTKDEWINHYIKTNKNGAKAYKITIFDNSIAISGWSIDEIEEKNFKDVCYYYKNKTYKSLNYK